MKVISVIIADKIPQPPLVDSAACEARVWKLTGPTHQCESLFFLFGVIFLSGNAFYFLFH